MVVFALLATVLFAVAGLAVDAGISYLTDNQAERAAAAGALAGVPYMPNGWGSSADGAARSASARNGFADGGTRNGHSVAVSLARYPAGCGSVASPCDSNKLTVSVTSWAQTSFLRMLGFGDHQVVASATAFYLPPIALGQPGAQLGSSVDALGSANNYYILRHEGYGNDRQEGDAFTPTTTQQTFNSSNGCDVTENTAGYGSSTDSHSLSASAGTDVSSMPAPYNPLPSRGGYNYAITVPSTVAQASVRVYNPAFAPDGGYNPNPNYGTSSNYTLHEQDGSFSGNGSTSQYSALEYTIFKVVDVFDHTQDVPLSQVVVDPINADPNNSSYTDVSNGQSIPASVVSYAYHGWVDVGNPSSTSWTAGGKTYKLINVLQSLSGGTLGPGNYRLRVDMLDYKGRRPTEDVGALPCSRAHKGYALQLSTPRSGGGYQSCNDPACNVSGIGEMAVYTPIVSSGGSFSLPVFQLSKDYRAKTVNFFIFDPGDVSGSNTLTVVNPDTGAVLTADPGAAVNIYDLGVSRNVTPTPSMLVNTLYPGSQPSTTRASLQTVVNGSNVYNSHWLLFELPIPATYNGGAGSYWTLQYTVNGQAGDTVTLAVSYGGSAVHLIN
ncbi:MAG TPA: hypothetical protein VGQ42_00915 [Candidatus Dormibacteraeota bacterium]|jgi:hypothetical protein|nr:hypothetical protein [Candidatus Dormibacteraeota bacterium]